MSCLFSVRDVKAAPDADVGVRVDVDAHADAGVRVDVDAYADADADTTSGRASTTSCMRDFCPA